MHVSTLSGILTDPKYKKMQKCFEGMIVGSTKASFYRNFQQRRLPALLIVLLFLMQTRILLLYMKLI